MALTPELKKLIEQGNDCVKQNKFHHALLFYNNAILLNPDHTEALVSCAHVLIDLNRATEAAIYSQRALQLNHTHNTLSLHGKILYLMGDYQQALTCFEEIITNLPDNYIALGQRALCLTQISRHQEALQVYQQALSLCNGQDPWIYYNYSLCLLATGNLTLGFTAFEYRWLGPLQTKNRAWIVPEHAIRETLQGKSILIHSEQGLGDSIQFFRYIPLLVQLGARVFLELHPNLIPLLNAWRTTIQMIATGSTLPHCDYHCPLMSLARLFKTEIHTIPHCIPYLSPDLPAFETCQKKLGPPSNAKSTRIGIAWRGSSLNVMNHQRSIALNTLLGIYLPSVEFICLQNDVHLEEKNALDHYNIAYHGLELNTLVGTAALIACLDLVITVDTSIAHLAAAMGKETWIILSMSADWRWFLQREDSPWYANVKLFRQTTLNDWSIPLSQIKNALQTFQTIQFNGSVDQVMHQANIQFQQGLLSQADKLYRMILVKNPVHHGALHGIAIIAFQQNNLTNAIQWMHQAVEIAPHMILYRRNLGELLRRVGQSEAAIAVHQMTVNLEPNGAENHYLLALAYQNNQQVALAIQHYRKALSFDQNHGMAWNNLGASLESMGDKEQAKNAYANAIRINPKHVEAQNNLGAIYSEEGRLDEARQHFTAAIAENPNFIDAHYNLSLIKSYTQNDPHLTSIESLQYEVEQYPLPMRIRYYFTLGKALDDLKKYQRAFKAYAEGNRLHYLHKPWDKTKLTELVEQMFLLFPRAATKPSQKTTETRCPIFIVGMPRSGTTLIEQILASHQQIHGAGELSTVDDVIQSACRSVNMPFNQWVMQLSDQDYADLGEQYLQKTSKLAADKPFIVDKMPSNWFYVGMIYRMLPQAKIIHAIRDPMDSCFSCFTHHFKESMTFAYDLTALGNYYALYAKTMQHWYEVLPNNTLFDVSYVQLVADPEQLCKQLIDYIGLSWDPNCLLFYKNNRVVKTASLTQVRQPIYKSSLQRWRHFAEELQPLLQLVESYRHLNEYVL